MSSDSADQQVPDLITATLADFVDRREIPGVVAAVTDVDRIVYTCALGLASRRNGIAMAPDTIFRVASMTKLITSIGVMLLVDEGAVNLDAPLEQYIPDYRQPEVLIMFDESSGEYRTRPARSQASVRQLLTHTAGYGYWFLDARLHQVLGGRPAVSKPPFLVADPGTRFTYGTASDLLGDLIEAVSQTRLDKFFAQRIFAPLGLRNTGFELPGEQQRLAGIFAREDEGFTELETESAGQPPRGGGGLYSTADDYCRVLRLLLNGGDVQGKRLLSEAACRQMASNQIGDLTAQVQTSAMPERSNDFIFMSGTQKFGLGLALDERAGPSGRPAGTGSWAGIYNTYFWIDFANEFAATVMMQVSPFADPWCVAARQRFEQALYDSLVEV